MENKAPLNRIGSWYDDSWSFYLWLTGIPYPAITHFHGTKGYPAYLQDDGLAECSKCQKKYPHSMEKIRTIIKFQRMGKARNGI